MSDAAISIKIGSPGDSSAVAAMVVIDSRLHAVTGRSVHAIHLADNTDPGRTNPAIPGIITRLALRVEALNQRLYPIGKPFVQET